MPECLYICQSMSTVVKWFPGRPENAEASSLFGRRAPALLKDAETLEQIAKYMVVGDQGGDLFLG